MGFTSALKRLVYTAALIVSGGADLVRYFRSGAVFWLYNSDRKIAALIRKDCHRIEKGLALPAPRPWFGQKVLNRMARNLDRYSARGLSDGVVLGECATIATRYHAFFSEKSPPCPDTIAEDLRRIGMHTVENGNETVAAGVRILDVAEVRSSVNFDYERFLSSRSSVRVFDGSVSDAIIKRAVTLAIMTPSVCNRCPWRVYHISDAEAMKRVLGCQNGNAGFGHTCGNVLVIAMDLRCFEGAGERNQAYVDGGLFAMNLVNALHSQFVATCFLNWSADFLQDSRLRRVLNIPSYEVVITLVGVGKYPEELSVAVSPRPRVDEVLSNVAIC